MQKQNNTTTTKYPLATAGKRILAKAIDIAIISVLVLCLGFAIFCTDPNFSWTGALVLQDKWRYGLFVTLMAIIFFGLMLLLPRLWNKTIGMCLFKLSYFKRQDCNHTFAIFKHELFVWEVVVFIALIMGWTLSFLNNDQIDALLKGAMSIFASQVPEGVDKVCYYVGTGFSCFYGVSIIFLIAIIVAICIKNHRPAFHDKYSHIYVIHNKPIIGPVKLADQLVKEEDLTEVKIPGVISAESFEEIDKI